MSAEERSPAVPPESELSLSSDMLNPADSSEATDVNTESLNDSVQVLDLEDNAQDSESFRTADTSLRSKVSEEETEGEVEEVGVSGLEEDQDASVSSANLANPLALSDNETENNENSFSNLSATPGEVDKDGEDEEKKKDDTVEVMDEGETDRVEGEESNGNADADADADQKDKEKDEGEDGEEEDLPLLRVRNAGIFEEEEEEDEIMEVPVDEGQNDDPPDIASMMHMSFREDSGEESQDRSRQGSPSAATNGETSQQSRRPRRAAAQAAADTIRDISTDEATGDPHRSSRRSRADDDETYYGYHTCNFCKKINLCEVKVRQYGTDVYYCDNNCLKKHRPEAAGFGRLPCSKCYKTFTDSPNEKSCFWETMIFCSDICVGKYQAEIGASCATCSGEVPWLSLGKYCVRFGSDIRQFCSAPCLETYKKSARVCFHCQLDIKRLGNVILANIPAKVSPKEFCSQECVEMYVEQNLQPTRVKPPQSCICVTCGYHKECYREFVQVTPRPQTSKVCSETCWSRLLELQQIMGTVKCETCHKFTSSELNPSLLGNYVCTIKKVFIFCSPTCKNVFVLKNRLIVGCVTCKVKKYNYDLIQFYQGVNCSYSTCSLNCLPLGNLYINNIRRNISQDTGMDGIPVISSVCSMSGQNNTLTLNSGSNTTLQPIIMDASGNILQLPAEADLSQILRVDSSPGLDGVTFASAADLGIEDRMDLADKLDSLENWDGVLTAEDIEEILRRWKVPETRSKATMCRPKTMNATTQTEESAVKDMERIPLTTLIEKQYVPFPMPIPVFIPVPVYMMETPVPCFFPVPMPYPFPIPVIFNGKNKNGASADVSSEDVQMLDESCKTEIEGSSQQLDVDADGSSQTTARTSSEVSSAAGNLSTSTAPATSGKKKLTRIEYGLKSWKMSFGQDSDPVTLNSEELAVKLTEWVNTGRKPNGERYRADIMVYLCLGVQQYLREKSRPDNIFYDPPYASFVDAITNYADSDGALGINTRIDDNHFWETNQLGDSCPGVLLFTLVYFFYKSFGLKTWESQAALTFGQVQIERKTDPKSGKDASFLRLRNIPECEGVEVIEKSDNPDHCPIRLYQYYMSKCSSTEGQIYKSTDSKANLDDDTWYTEEDLDQMKIYQMLVRAMMIKAETDK